ncbi:hypothetical protein GQ43DRAFT_444295 [Delitschia confertaspora ATCC 74209]|uniref:Polyketide cyclase/dehydrase n=1 Tax=Delitschia confertaspora ATCC 74209 TaxID=1513339 RepID=A0A9P4JDZ5_9PLEO|nr:hypothetical protein GQ43DRAFT_444295 [Delitschia confertaspora ATCC 74209]
MAPVISINVEVHIKAPATFVWSKLIDTSTYPSWNTFIPQADILDPKDDPHSELLKLGSRRCFHPVINGKKTTSTQRVTVYETPDGFAAGPKKYRICWVVEGFPPFIFNTLRSNEIEEVQEEDGPGCIYRTGEDQFGPMAYVVKMVVGKAVEKGIQQWADDLKKFCEAEYAKEGK